MTEFMADTTKESGSEQKISLAAMPTPSPGLPSTVPTRRPPSRTRRRMARATTPPHTQDAMEKSRGEERTR